MGAGEWRARSDAAQVIANFLRCHPRVAEVRYPGLTSDPDYRQASSTLRGGFGPTVWFRAARPVDGADCDSDLDPGWRVFHADETDARDQVMVLEELLRVCP